MDLYIPQKNNEEFETKSKAEVLEEIEPQVDELMAKHKKKRRLWFASDFLPADEKMDDDKENVIKKLRERARGIADSVRVSLVLNLITEEGLPHFHRLLSTYLGDNSVWKKWNFMWTAEEDRHGNILRDYVRDSRLFKFRHVEMLQYYYQESGFNPSWDKDPYKVFVYTTLQERATQFSHKNTGVIAGDEEPLIRGILRNIATDEAKHFSFYRNVFKNILEIDPNRALKSALAILPSIDMPGVNMPKFNEMADIVRRVGIYGPWEYRRIVDETVDYWNIGMMTDLNEVGRKAQEKIMKLPKRLEKVAKYIEHKTQQKSFSFDFLYGRAFTL